MIIKIGTGEQIERAMVGRFFRVMTGTYPITVQFVDADGGKTVGPIPMEQGQYIKFNWQFQRVVIESATAQTLELLAIDGEFGDDRTDIGSGTLNVEEQPNGDLVDIAGTAVGAGLCVAQANLGADPTRLKAIVGNPLLSPNEIYVRGNVTAAASPLVIQPGGIAVVDGISALFVFNPGAVSITPLLQKVVAS